MLDAPKDRNDHPMPDQTDNRCTIRVKNLDCVKKVNGG